MTRQSTIRCGSSRLNAKEHASSRRKPRDVSKPNDADNLAIWLPNGLPLPNLLRNTLTIHRRPMTCLDSFSSMPDLHSPGGLGDLSQSTVHDEILVTSGEPTGDCGELLRLQ